MSTLTCLSWIVALGLCVADGMRLSGGVRVFVLPRNSWSIKKTSFLKRGDHDLFLFTPCGANGQCIYRHQSSNALTLYVHKICMGRGDGKKRRPKKKKTTLNSSGCVSVGSGSSTPPSPPPQRVSNSINVPVRMQIRLAQARKEAERRTANGSFRANNLARKTAYRKRLDAEEKEAARAERSKRGQNPDWNVILNNTAASPLVIVDGYNIIHKWPRLKKFMRKNMISRARDLLLHDLEELRALKGWRIEVVFDGGGRDTTGPLGDGPGGGRETRRVLSTWDEALTTSVTHHGVRVVYSGVGSTADTYIEARCFEAKTVTKGKITANLIVASNDAMVRVAGQNAGAHCMSADRFVDELRAAKKSVMYKVEVAVAKANGHTVRPRKLQGKIIPRLLGTSRGQIIVEDKRSRKKKSSKSEAKRFNMTDIMAGTKTLPSWAVVPNATMREQ